MRKIIISLSVVAAVAAAVVVGTTAFFSDTEQSTGNTFTAGALDLKVDSTQHYNNAVCNANNVWELESGQTATVPQYPVLGTACGGTWGQTPEGKDIVDEKFFNFADVKPGDSGENTISLHVINNDAWVCAEVSGLTSNDVSQTEPESQAVLDTDDMASGELDDTMIWTIWRDNGAGNGVAGDNIQNGSEETLATGHPVNGVLPVYDSTTGAPLTGSSTTYLGVKWELPLATGNEVQTDSLTGDISFRVEQARNNANFRCVPPVITTIYRTQVGFGDGGWAGWSCPANTTAVSGGINSSTNPVGGNGVAAPSAPAVDGFNYPTYPHYAYNSSAGETGYVVHDLPGDSLGNTISFHVDCQAN